MYMCTYGLRIHRPLPAGFARSGFFRCRAAGISSEKGGSTYMLCSIALCSIFKHILNGGSNSWVNYYVLLLPLLRISILLPLTSIVFLTNAHTYMHAYIHTYIHMYIHTYIHTYLTLFLDSVCDTVSDPAAQRTRKARSEDGVSQQ